MGDVRTELEPDIPYEQPDQTTCPGKNQKKKEVEQCSGHDQWTSTAKTGFPAVRDGTGNGLHHHCNEKSNKREQTKIGILLLVGDIVEQNGWQNDWMQRIPHERQPDPISIQDQQL